MASCPVERQLEAYNARDVGAFVPCFSEDVVVEDGSGTVRMRGRGEFHARYSAAFAAEPAVRCEIVHRIRHGEYVVDHENLTGYRSGERRQAVAIYRVQGDVITHVRFL